MGKVVDLVMRSLKKTELSQNKIFATRYNDFVGNAHPTNRVNG
jgi:hypothetical protein